MILFFALLVMLCPLIGQEFISHGGEISSLTPCAAAQEKKKVQPRQITDFTAKKKTAAKAAEPSSDTEKAAVPAADEAAAPSEDGTDAAAKQDVKDPYAYEAPKEDESSYGWMIFKTILVLIIFGLGFYFFFKYVSKKAGLPNVGRGVVQVLAVSPVGQNRFIQIVDIAGKVMVLGVTEGSITMITEITGRDDIDRIRLLSSKTTPIEVHGFQEFISEQVSSLIDFVGKAKTSLEKKKNAKQRSFEPENDYYDDRKVDYMREQRERLKKMNGYRDDDEK